MAEVALNIELGGLEEAELDAMTDAVLAGVPPEEEEAARLGGAEAGDVGRLVDVGGKKLSCEGSLLLPSLSLDACAASPLRRDSLLAVDLGCKTVVGRACAVAAKSANGLRAGLLLPMTGGERKGEDACDPKLGPKTVVAEELLGEGRTVDMSTTVCHGRLVDPRDGESGDVASLAEPVG